MMKNNSIAEIFERIANILEFQGEIPFKVNAYRKASRVIQDLQEDIEILWQQGKLRELPGIGEALVKKIDEYIRTGKVSKYEEISRHVPPELMRLLAIQNLGPKTLALAHRELKVNNLQDLLQVIEDGRFAQLPGMGQKKAENIQRGIKFFLSAQERIPLGTALPVVEDIIQLLHEKTTMAEISPAGSLRRMKETVGDIDILVGTNNPAKIIKEFIALPQVNDIIAAGETKASIHLEQGYQVDLRVVFPDSFGAALQYFTGSQAHNIKLRGLAKKQSLKINEYGIFRDDFKIAGAIEEDIYHAIGLDWIPPEMREDRGEIELAAEKKLPLLITLQDVQGDLHVHSTYSDGHASIQVMVDHAREMGYQYLAICDHSWSARYAQGLSIEQLLRQAEEIDELNRKSNDFKILKSIEVDILTDGSLDFPDEVLARLDLVVAAIHSNFTRNPTERIVKAMQNPLVDIIAHPTGRLISRREGYEVDLNKIFEQARKSGTALEINCHPERLDLSDVHAKKAAEMGILLALNTDAHSPDNLSLIKYGIGTARRAWLSKNHILNCMSYQQIMHWKKQRLSKNRNG